MAVRRDGAGGQHFGGKRCAGKSVTGEVLTEVEGTGQEYIASVSVAVEDASTVGRMIGTGPEGNISDFCSGTVRAGMLERSLAPGRKSSSEISPADELGNLSSAGRFGAGPEILIWRVSVTTLELCVSAGSGPAFVVVTSKIGGEQFSFTGVL